MLNIRSSWGVSYEEEHGHNNVDAFDAAFTYSMCIQASLYIACGLA